MKEDLRELLQEGRVATLADGRMYLVIKGKLKNPLYRNQKIILTNNTNFYYLENFDCELKVPFSSEHNIERIYEPCCSSLRCIFEDCNDSNLIWERKPEIDWSKVEVDAKVYIKEMNFEIPRHFTGVYTKDYISFYMHGATSFTSTGTDKILTAHKNNVRLVD